VSLFNPQRTVWRRHSLAISWASETGRTQKLGMLVSASALEKTNAHNPIIRGDLRLSAQTLINIRSSDLSDCVLLIPSYPYRAVV